MRKVIYLDNASTTAVHKDVVRVMNEFFIEKYGNASSTHALGEQAHKKIEEAKKILAKEINCKPWEIVFTSGGTESNNFALWGTARANKDKKKIIISAIEHSSVYEECQSLKKWGYQIVEIPVNKDGFIDFSILLRELDKNTLMVSIMRANNEIGVLQDIAKIGKICSENGILFHTDAVQSFGKEKIDVKAMNIDLLSASAHKINGPKGVGFLYIKEGIKIEPIIVGGGQEAGKRGGTENIPAIAGLAKALEMTKKIDKNKIEKLRDYLMSELKKIGGKINGSTERRVCNNVNVSFSGKDAEQIVIALSEKGIMCSTKSACLSKQHKENRVLKAIGLDEKGINGALRFSLSSDTKKTDVDYVIKEIKSLTK